MKKQPGAFTVIHVPQLEVSIPKAELAKALPAALLKTANETVGSLLSLALTVHDNKVFDMMDKVGKKQQQRYLTFPVTVAQ